MLASYPACFFKEDNGYSVVFPDLNYLATCGETQDEAMAMAIDALAGYIFTCKQDKEKIPQPSALPDIDIDTVNDELEGGDYEGFVTLVAVDVEEYARAHFEKSVKKTLTIPAWLNTAALEHNLNFSQVLQDALKQQLHMQQ